MMMEMLLGAGHVKLGDMDELLRKHLSRYILHYTLHVLPTSYSTSFQETQPNGCCQHC